MPLPLRVLLADDDGSFTLLTEQAIADLPDVSARCRVTYVGDGTEAVAYVEGRGAYADRARHPLPHLVILDQRMRLMDGTEVIQALRRLPVSRHLPICLLSTSARRSQVELAYELGATFCIEKPMDFDSLQAKLHLLLQFALDVLDLTAAR